MPLELTNKCIRKRRNSTSSKNSFLTIFNGFIIAILPKCSFCVLAYSSAIAVCGGKAISAHSPEWTSWISVTFAVFTLLIVLYNWKGIKTVIAGLTLLTGTLLIFNAEILTGDMNTYYWGTSFIFFGVWLNGSFLFFFNLITKVLSPNKIS